MLKSPGTGKAFLSRFLSKQITFLLDISMLQFVYASINGALQIRLKHPGGSLVQKLGKTSTIRKRHTKIWDSLG